MSLYICIDHKATPIVNPHVNYGLWVICYLHIGSLLLTNVPSGVGGGFLEGRVLIIREAVHVWGQRAQGNFYTFRSIFLLT